MKRSAETDEDLEEVKRVKLEDMVDEGGSELVIQTNVEEDLETSQQVIEVGSILQQEEIPVSQDGEIITVATADAQAGEAQLVTIDTSQTHIMADGQLVTIETNQGEVTGEGLVALDTNQQEVLHIQSEAEVMTTDGEVIDGEIALTQEGEYNVEQTDDGGTLQVLQPAPAFQNIIVQHMDIAAPLITLRKLLENRLQCSLDDHEFWLQDTHKLDHNKNLVSQCVQGSGMVQINVEVKSQPGIKPRLNIVDILKPAEEVVELPGQQVTAPPPPAPTKVVIPFPEESENVTRWIVDQGFRREQERLKIPFDPSQWNEAHVRHWIQWAVKEFTLEGVDIDTFKLSGRQLCDLRHEDFINYIPNDKGDIFWTHLELLRKCKFVAVIQQPTPHAITTITVSTSGSDFASQEKSFNRQKARSFMLSTDRGSPGNRTGNNGQIQLWQFLLELLTDKDCREVIQWVGDDGEFKLNHPEAVAQMWGQRKNKPTMNYEKLSRALRYYYDGDMIAKVHGKRFVYKFVCDLRMLLGYNAGELNRLVSECSEKKLQRVRDTLRPGLIKKVIEIEAK